LILKPIIRLKDNISQIKRLIKGHFTFDISFRKTEMNYIMLEVMNKKPAVNKVHIAGRIGGTPTADSRIAVPSASWRTGSLSEIRPDNIYQPLCFMLREICNKCQCIFAISYTQADASACKRAKFLPMRNLSKGFLLCKKRK